MNISYQGAVCLGGASEQYTKALAVSNALEFDGKRLCCFSKEKVGDYSLGCFAAVKYRSAIGSVVIGVFKDVIEDRVSVAVKHACEVFNYKSFILFAAEVNAVFEVIKTGGVTYCFKFFNCGNSSTDIKSLGVHSSLLEIIQLAGGRCLKSIAVHLSAAGGNVCKLN